MASADTGKRGVLILLSIVCVIFIAGLVILFIHFNSKVNSLKNENTNLLSQKENLISEKQNLIAQKEKIKDELNTSMELIASKEKEFNDHKEILKKYFLTAESIQDDILSISVPLEELLYGVTNNYDHLLSKILAYEGSLSLLRLHVEVYIDDLLVGNKEILEEIGINTEINKKSMEEMMEAYENIRTEARETLELLKSTT